ncbi:MAG: hypothetical protein IJJ13_03225 [Lachnospiraceae bacterium]|nr:hypothetical protein [Lachnospiraceae bacterium]
MATSTILEPIKVNDENGAKIIVEALEKAENTSRNRSVKKNLLTTDPEAVRRIAKKAMDGVAKQ